MNAKQNRVNVNLPQLTTAKLGALTNEATTAYDPDAAEWPDSHEVIHPASFTASY